VEILRNRFFGVGCLLFMTPRTTKRRLPIPGYGARRRSYALIRAGFSTIMLTLVFAFSPDFSVLRAAQAGTVEGACDFDVPAGEATRTLSIFSAQADVQLLFATDHVIGIRTNRVQGRLLPREALEAVVAGTGLTVVLDERTSALGLVRDAPPHVRELQGRSAGSPPKNSRSAIVSDPNRNSMQRRNPLVLLLSLFALGTAVPQSTAQPATELVPISGRVFNEGTGDYLEGAEIRLQGRAAVSLSDREGRYVISSPPGSVILTVSYAGLDMKAIPVDIFLGKPVQKDIGLTSAIYRLEKFTVAGEREGMAKAETLQRQAPNVKTVVSSDMFGSVADGNIGDFLQRVAGITADFNGPEVRQVTIRGIGAELNSMTMDGQQVATSQSAGAGRQFEFEQSSLSNVERIEVTKAPTPDMDGASVGGSVNLVSKSAFDRAGGRLITYTLGLTARSRNQGNQGVKWQQPIKGFGPTASFSYQDVLGEKRNLGITFTGIVHSQPAGTAIISNSFERKATPGPVFNYATTRQQGSSSYYARVGASMKIDYRYSDQTTFTFNTTYNHFYNNGEVYGQALTNIGVPTAAVPNVLATVDANGRRTGGGYINPNYSDTFTQLYANPSATSVITQTTNNKTGRTYVFSPRVRHRFAHGLDIDYSVSYSNSATYYDVSQNDPKFRSRPRGTITYRLANIGWIVDRSQDRFFPTITQTDGPNMFNLANYSNLLLTQTDQRGYDTVINGKFDLKKDLRLVIPTFVKTGFTVQQQSRKLWNDPRRYNYTGPDGVFGNADDNVGLIQFIEGPRAAQYNTTQLFKTSDGIPPWTNPYGVARHQKDFPGFWKEDIAFTSGKLTSFRTIDEMIAAAYVMGNVRLGRLTALAGFRVEETRNEGEGPFSRVTPEEAARRAAWVGPVTDNEQRRRNLVQFGGRVSREGKYRSYLPGVHLKYELFAGMIARLSWSTGVGRPGFGSIIPNETVNDTAETITVTNPELRPQYSRSWDLSAEYYFKPQGMVSIGAFRKRIKDYIASNNSRLVEDGPNNGFDGQFAGYRMITSINDGTATVEGIEASYQQQLTFLPGWAKGLGIYTNFTKLRAEGNNSQFVTGAAGRTLAGFLDTTGNIGLGYRSFGWDLRMQAVYRGKFLVSNNANPALVRWQMSKWTWTWKSRYNFSRRFGVFLDLENVFEAPINEIYSAYPDRVDNYRPLHVKIIGGLTGRF
jgi:iron complex outermembrane receptor protein